MVELDFGPKQSEFLLAAYKEAAQLDPLGLDLEFLEARNITGPEAVGKFIGKVSEAVMTFNTQIDIVNRPKGLAYKRDFGYAGTMIRNLGFELDVVPGLQEAMVKTSQYTGEGPVWSVWDYANSNPEKDGFG